MPKPRCPVIDHSSHYDAWLSVRNYFGPITMSDDYREELYTNDMQQYSNWVTAGGHTDSVKLFGNWLVWKFRTGTNDFGNLQLRKRDHVGLSCAPCPYDTKSNDDRSEIMLGHVPTKEDHGIYYMGVTCRVSVWGFECTYPGCPYFLSNGKPYFFK